MSNKPMTDEEYLRAKGWTVREDKGWWCHPRHCAPERSMRLAEAVAAQLREDRRIYNFVRARSAMHGAMLFEASPEHAAGNIEWLEAHPKGE